jgi:hypothetical protein
MLKLHIWFYSRILLGKAFHLGEKHINILSGKKDFCQLLKYEIVLFCFCAHYRASNIKRDRPAILYGPERATIAKVLAWSVDIHPYMF